MAAHNPPSDDDRDPRDARLRPQAADVANVRALLGEIDRRVFAAAGPAPGETAKTEIERAVLGLFSHD